ncbi:hypothetical protein FRC08_006478 [Ceratobasidium sp. 394]|nr:hypothetical protein FRC08_006478 [Ceratobasidium sp. 394]
MVTHLTKAGIHGGRNCSTEELFALIALKSRNLRALELGIRIDSVMNPYILDPLRSLDLLELSMPISRMDNLHLIHTIGEMWPALEVLDLSLSAIDLLDFLDVSKSLPKLKRLVMNLPVELSYEVRKLAEKPCTPANFEAWEASSFTLVSGMAWANWVIGPDVDVLALLLAMASPNIKLKFSSGTPTVGPIGVSLQERVSYHSRKLLSAANPQSPGGTSRLSRNDDGDA